MATPPKIIVLGSLNGQLEPALKKLTALQAKNSFSFGILVGDVFNPNTPDSVIDSLLKGTLEVPLPTYFTVGNHPLPPRIAEKVETDEEICPNLHFLGKRSITKLSEGLRIVTLGGQLDAKLIGGQSKEQHLPYHTTDDIKALKGANSADILLTSSWPQGVWERSQAALTPDQQASIITSLEIAELCTALKPRYHFSASPGPFFYEREPFIHVASEEEKPSNDTSNAVTRFISMAPFGNDAKQKAMYAFSLNKTDTSIPQNATITPFKPKRKPLADDQYNRFGNQHHNNHHRGGKKHGRRRSPPPGPDRCYFCLSNPNISDHMVCCIGDDAYLTTAKGPLTTALTFSDLGLSFPGQLIIIPLPHEPTLSSMGMRSINQLDNDEPSENDPKKTYAEMTRFRESIQAMIAKESSHKLGAITYEISRDRNVHLIWQLHAFPADKIRSGIAEAAFRVEAENSSLPAFETREMEIDEQLKSSGDFFRVWLWCDGEDKIKGKSLVMPLAKEDRFDIQFGRRVLAKLLGLEGRMRWQECEQSVEEETKDVETFREAFKEWDFTL